MKPETKRNFIEQIKYPILLEALSAVKAMQESQSNQEQKENPTISRGNFSSRTSLSIFTSNSYQRKTNNQMKQVEFSWHLNQQANFYPSPQSLLCQIQVLSQLKLFSQIRSPITLKVEIVKQYFTHHHQEDHYCRTRGE